MIKCEFGHSIHRAWPEVEPEPSSDKENQNESENEQSDEQDDFVQPVRKSRGKV